MVLVWTIFTRGSLLHEIFSPLMAQLTTLDTEILNRRLLAAHRSGSVPLPQRRLLLPPLALRLGPRIGSSARRRRPATEGQSQARRRRRRLPPPSLASRLAPSPASSAHRQTTLRTHLPLPSRRCCSRGSPATTLAPPVPIGIFQTYMGKHVFVDS